ncbi:MAG: glycosyltransferase family 4 protein [Candidatus Woesearchaeota archaeon]
MRVVVSNYRRFWAFRMAEELERHNALKYLFTQEPRRKEDAIPKDKIIGLNYLRLTKGLEISSYFIPFIRGVSKWVDYKKRRVHDRFVSEYIGGIDFDVLITWPLNPLTIKKAKERDILTVVDSGSTHPNFQKKILMEENKLIFGKEIQTAPESIIMQEIADYNSCDLILVPSHFVKKTFVANGIEESKIIVVPFGVDTDIFKRKRKRDKVFRIVWCGTICIRKGIHYLLRAFHELAIPNSELLLIGGISEEMKSFVERYKAQNIIYKGPVAQKSLPELYSQGSIFVHPSLEEGLSLVQLEAMACGLPIICTTNTGGDEIIKDGVEGFIIPIRDVGALKKKINYLYENPIKLKEMSNAAVRRANKYTWKHYGDNLIKNLKKAVKDKKMHKIIK